MTSMAGNRGKTRVYYMETKLKAKAGAGPWGERRYNSYSF
jgi:hypothetical protein